MSITRRILFGAAASWFSRLATIVMGLVLMPVLFRNLPKEELGVWLLFGQTLAGVAIFDLGFGSTLTRRIALAKGKSGSDPTATLTDETLDEIANLVTIGRRAYLAIAAASFTVMWAVGVVFLRRLDYVDLSASTAITAWTILCVAQGLLLLASVWTSVLQGVGYIGWEAVLATFANALTLLVQIIVALFGGGLVGLALVAAAGSLAQRFLLRAFAQRRRPELFALVGRWDAGAFRSMVSPALRSWLTAVGFFFVNYTDQFFITASEGVDELPAYRAAWLLVHNVMLCAVTVGMASGVFVSHLWQQGQISEIHRVLIRNARLGLLIMLTATAVLAIAGESTFDLWLGPGNFVGYQILFIFLTSELLATQSEVISVASRATEDEVYVLCAFSAGMLKLLLAFTLLPIVGLVGLALANALSLILTNQWYMVVRGLSRLKMSFSTYFRQVITPCIAIFLSSIVVLWIVGRALRDFNDLWQVLGVGGAGAVLLGMATWGLVLEASHRSRFTRQMGLLIGSRPMRDTNE
jgi:O-antigen/teichoic acid export membrane protein